MGNIKIHGDKNGKMHNKLMAISTLEDGREHIHCKNNKPLEYDFTKKGDRDIIKSYEKLYIEQKKMCYNKDLTLMCDSESQDKEDRVFVKDIRLEPYEDIYIPYRCFCIMTEKGD